MKIQLSKRGNKTDAEVPLKSDASSETMIENQSPQVKSTIKQQTDGGSLATENYKEDPDLRN